MVWNFLSNTLLTKFKSNFLVSQSHWVITEWKCSRTSPENVFMHSTVPLQVLFLNPKIYKNKKIFVIGVRPRAAAAPL
jgi:hypothetical protein